MPILTLARLPAQRAASLADRRQRLGRELERVAALAGAEADSAVAALACLDKEWNRRYRRRTAVVREAHQHARLVAAFWSWVGTSVDDAASAQALEGGRTDPSAGAFSGDYEDHSGGTDPCVAGMALLRRFQARAELRRRRHTLVPEDDNMMDASGARCTEEATSVRAQLQGVVDALLVGAANRAGSVEISRPQLGARRVRRFAREPPESVG